MQRIKRVFRSVLIVLGLLAWEPSARAAILFAGGEDIDFAFSGTTATDTTAGNFRSTYAREAIKAVNTSSADPQSNRFQTSVFANQSTIWVHSIEQTNNATTASNGQFIGIYGSDGVRRLLIRGTGTNGQVKISTRNTAGTITDLVTCTAGPWPAAANTKLDWYINYAVAGRTTLYAAGVQICDYTGDITTNSVTAINSVDFAGATFTGQNFWSEIIVATTDTRDMNLFTCAPQANGTTQNFTGTASSVNPTTINDANAIYTGSNNVIGAFTCPSLVAGTYTVPAVVQSVRTQIGTTGPQNFRYITRPAGSGADFDNGADIVGATSFTNTQNIWLTDPNTLATWTTGALGTGVNFGVKSRP